MPKVSEAYIEERRQQILDAAVACFGRKGFHQTTMEDIGREAGLSHGVAYRYFDSKDEIIQAAARRGPDPDLQHWIEEEVERYDDFPKLIEMFTRISYQRYEEGEAILMAMQLRLRAWAEALQNPEVREEVIKRWGTHLAVTEQMVRRAQDLGQINPDLDPGAAARVMQAIGDGFTLLWTINPDFDIWQFQQVELALYCGTFWCGEKEETFE